MFKTLEGVGFCNESQMIRSEETPETKYNKAMIIKNADDKNINHTALKIKQYYNNSVLDLSLI